MRVAVRAAAVAAVHLVPVLLLASTTRAAADNSNSSGSYVAVEFAHAALHQASPHKLESALFLASFRAAARCPSGNKLERFCKKSCPSKSSKKCKSVAKKLRRCCGKKCSCRDRIEKEIKCPKGRLKLKALCDKPCPKRTNARCRMYARRVRECCDDTICRCKTTNEISF